MFNIAKISFKAIILKTLTSLLIFMGVFACQNSNANPNINSQEEASNEETRYSPEVQKIFDQLETNDSLLFGLGYNHCDTFAVKKLLSENMEFYHDQAGIIKSKADFVKGISGLCQLDYKPTRELVDKTLKVFPLYNNGKLYGAIQKGVHEFYGEEENKPKYLTSTARFTHVWILEEEEWKLQRVLSYDHIPAEN